jgi:hypothetical protein
MTQTATTQRPTRPEPTYTFNEDARRAAARCKQMTVTELARQPRTTLVAEAERLGIQNPDGLFKTGLAEAIANCANVVVAQTDTERDTVRKSEASRRWEFFFRLNSLLEGAQRSHADALEKLNTPERIGDEHYTEQLLEAGRKIRAFAWIVAGETSDEWPFGSMQDIAKCLTDDTIRRARYGSRRSSSPIRNVAEEFDCVAIATAAELARDYSTDHTNF